MRPSSFALVVLGLALHASPTLAAPRSKVAWGEVAVREGDDAERLTKKLQRFLKEATRRADWGKRKDPKSEVALKAQLTRFEWHESEGVLRLDVAAVGRVVGGPGVKTKIRVGGKPNERSKLEKEGLRIVADGLVTRLAEIVRKR